MFRHASEKEGRANLNAQPPDRPAQPSAERSARHLAMLQRLSELGMRLAERAAEEALAEPADPETQGQRPSRPAVADPRMVFVRLSRMVRDTIALEARLAAGIVPAAPAAPAEDDETRTDPRRPAITACLDDIIEGTGHSRAVKADLRQRTRPLITDGLASDPGQVFPGGAIVLEICQVLGLNCDISQMPDELLVPLHEPYTQADRDSVAPQVAALLNAQAPPP